MQKVMEILKWVLFAISFFWQLPQNIVALVMMPFLGKLELISFKKQCFAFKGSHMSGGISLGNFAFLSPYSAKFDAVVAHEQCGHTLQSKMLGPLYLIVIGLPSILHAAFHKNCPCYYHFFTEAWANSCAHLGVGYRKDGSCYLYFKKY